MNTNANHVYISCIHIMYTGRIIYTSYTHRKHIIYISDTVDIIHIICISIYLMICPSRLLVEVQGLVAVPATFGRFSTRNNGGYRRYRSTPLEVCHGVC